MKRVLPIAVFIFTLCCLCIGVFAQSIGIGTSTPNASAILDVSSTSKGVLLPRMSTTQRNAIVSPAIGLIIFNTDDQCTDIFDGTNWIKNCGFKKGDSAIVPSNNWVQKADFGGTARSGAVGFSIGSKGYFGTGYEGSYKKDFWEYDPITNIWSQKADFGGAGRWFAVGFSIGNKGYVGTGYNTSYTNDFWEYNPAGNTWTQKANFGGTARYFAVGFSINNKGYIGTGSDGAYKNDFWEYDPLTDAWTQKANFGGTARFSAVGFSIGNKGYLGTGNDGNHRNDFWEYDPVANAWAPKANFGGTARDFAVGFSIGNKGYIGTGSFYTNDFWEYDPAANTWLKKASLPGIGRIATAGFSIGNRGYLGMGLIGSFLTGPLKDFWEYNQQPYNVTSYATNTSILSQGNFSDGIWTKTALNNITTSRNVGIGNDFPNAPLQFQNTAANRKIVLYEDYHNNHEFYGFGIGNSTMNYQVSSPFASHVFYAGTDANSSSELLRIQGNGNTNITGNLGIGTATPGFPLNFNSTVGDKISLFGSSGPHYGFGIQAGLMQIHSAGIGDDIALGYGSSSSFTERMRIKGNGNVGLGVTTPNARLQFSNDISQRKLVFYETANNDHQFYGFGVTSFALRYQTAATGNDHVFYAGTSATTSQELMRIKGNGNVGVGVSDPSFVLDIGGRMRIRSAPGFTAGFWLNNEANNGSPAFIGMQADNLIGFFGAGNGWVFNVNTTTGNANLSGSLSQNSDATLKTNIESIDNALPQLMQLSGYRYNWKDSANPDKQIGLLAQEVQKVYPELVKENSEGKLGVNYAGMVPVLLQAIKEQQRQIEHQQEQMQKLSKLNEQQHLQMESLKNSLQQLIKHK